MNDSAIKSYCIWARRELMAEVERRCAIYDISENPTSPADADAVNGRVLTGAEKEQRKELLGTVREEGYDQVVERAAYTWFNRIMAIRFMEVNDLLPSRTRMRRFRRFLQATSPHRGIIGRYRGAGPNARSRACPRRR